MSEYSHLCLQLCLNVLTLTETDGQMLTCCLFSFNRAEIKRWFIAWNLMQGAGVCTTACTTALLISATAIKDVTRKRNVAMALLWMNSDTLLNFDVSNDRKEILTDEAVSKLQIGTGNWGVFLFCRHVKLGLAVRDKSSRGGEEEREKKGGHTVSCKTSMCANGSRKRILILILHTQILLFSPTGLGYPTLRRQKAKPLLMFLTPADPFLCESSFPSGCREWKFSRDWLIPRCTAPRGRLQRWLYWDEVVRMTLLAREKPVASVRCFVLQPTSFMFWGKTERDGGCGIALSRGSLWGLSMNLATFKLVSMRQAFLVTVEKKWQAVLVFQTSCVIIRWGHWWMCHWQLAQSVFFPKHPYSVGKMNL